MWFDMSHKGTDGSLWVDENSSYDISFPDNISLWGESRDYSNYALSVSISVGYKFNNNTKKK